MKLRMILNYLRWPSVSSSTRQPKALRSGDSAARTRAAPWIQLPEIQHADPATKPSEDFFDGDDVCHELLGFARGTLHADVPDTAARASS
jgi:hypothetical protein